MSEKSISHRHEFIISSENITCAKCGKQVPIVENLKPEQPPLTLWCYLQRLGGLAGRSLYFIRIVEVKEVLQGEGGGAMYLQQILEERDFEGSGPGGQDIRQDIRWDIRQDIRWKDDKSLVINDVCLQDVKEICCISYDKPQFLQLANDQMLDQYFLVDGQQRDYLGIEGEVKHYLPQPLQAVKLEVKLGKIISLHFTKYEGAIKPFSHTIKKFLEKRPKPHTVGT